MNKQRGEGLAQWQGLAWADSRARAAPGDPESSLSPFANAPKSVPSVHVLSHNCVIVVKTMMKVFWCNWDKRWPMRHMGKVSKVSPLATHGGAPQPRSPPPPPSRPWFLVILLSSEQHSPLNTRASLRYLNSPSISSFFQILA